MLTGIMQPSLLFLILLFAYSHTIKPPGYEEPQKVDADTSPPKYEYGYNIVGDKGGEQGKQEQRDGIYASGRYFVQNKDARQDVQYFADDWGYHPAVEYANVGPHSKSSAKFALGHEAVVQLKNRENNLPQLEGLPETGPLKKEGASAPLIQTQTAKPLTPEPQNYQPQPSQQPLIYVTNQPNYDPFKQQQQITVEEPQEQHHQIIQEQPQQQIVVQHPNVVYEQQKATYEQPQFVYSQQPITYAQPQQVVQRIQEPIENVIFPQSTPRPVLHEQQPNLVLFEQNDVHQEQFGLKLKSRRPNKLIASTQHLVTGQDVLDINHATDDAAVSTTAAYEDYGIKSTTPYPSVTEITVTEPSFKEQPIVAADVENKIASTPEQEHFLSTTAGTIETVSTTFESSTPTPTILVTPKSVGSTFLPPITAESREHLEEKYKLSQQNVQIEIQKTVPYYLGGYQYPLGYGYVSKNHSCADQNNNLLYFPPTKHVTDIDNHINVQQLPSPTVENRFVELDQQVAQGYQHQVVYQQLPFQQEYTKVIHQPYPVEVPVTVEKVVEKPVHITKFVEKPVAVPQPYPVERIVEKPVHVPVQVTKYVDRPYPVEVRVPYPQPYPVEKIVQKIVKQPYPVEVRVPVHIDRIVEKKVPVPHYIEKPVPVEKIVEKPVTQYVDRPYPVHIQVPVPTPVAVPVDRIIEKKVPVPHYIEKQVPVEKVVEKPVPQYIDRPYPVEVKVPVPQPYYIKVEVPRPYHAQLPVKFNQRPYYAWPVQNGNEWNYGAVRVGSNLNAQLQHIQSGYSNNQKDSSQALNSYTNIKPVDQITSDGYHYPNPYAYASQSNSYLPPKQEFVIDKEYLPPSTHNCDHPPAKGNDNYLGLLPPKAEQNSGRYLRKYRTARSNFNDKNIKMEYGFMPPLVPSLEIDEYGQPVEKGEK